MVVADLDHVELLGYAAVKRELVLLDGWDHISSEIDSNQVQQLLRHLNVALGALHRVSQTADIVSVLEKCAD